MSPPRQGQTRPGQRLSQRPSLPRAMRAGSQCSSHGGVSGSQRQAARTDRWRRRRDERGEERWCRGDGPIIYRKESLNTFLCVFIGILLWWCSSFIPFVSNRDSVDCASRASRCCPVWRRTACDSCCCFINNNRQTLLL